MWVGTALLFGLLGRVAPLAAQAGPPLEEIMARLASVSSQEFRFTETANRALLAEPEVQRGTLIRVGPDHLLRVTESPETRWLLLSRDRLQEAVGTAKAQDSDAETFSFFREFARLFEGNLEVLNERYQLDFATQESGDWELTLEPRAKRVRELLDRIILRGQVAGSAASIREIELREAGGDGVHLQLSPVEVGRSWKPEQLEVLFESRTLP